MAVLLGVVLFTALPIQGSVLVNGSFESPVSDITPSLAVGSTFLDGWAVIGAEIALCVECADFGSAGGGSASEGRQSLDLTGYHDGLPYGGVHQVLATVPGQAYEVSFDVGARQGTSTVQLFMGLPGQGGGWPFDPSVLLASGSATSGGTEVVWKRASASFVATELSTAIALTGHGASWGGIFIGLDHVVVNPVPEPVSTCLVLAFAGVAVTAVHRRRRLGSDKPVR